MCCALESFGVCHLQVHNKGFGTDILGLTAFFLQDVWTNIDLNCFTCVSVRVRGTVSSLKRFRNAFKF